MMLDLQLDKLLGSLANLGSGSTIEIITFEVIKKAEAQGWSRELLQAARAAAPHNPERVAGAQQGSRAPGGLLTPALVLGGLLGALVGKLPLPAALPACSLLRFSPPADPGRRGWAPLPLRHLRRRVSDPPSRCHAPIAAALSGLDVTGLVYAPQTAVVLNEIADADFKGGDLHNKSAVPASPCCEGAF